MAGPKKKSSNPRAELDHYSLRAKQEGYPARSVYKLQEIQERFSLISPRGRILDIGAAPGSWSLYILRQLSGGNLTALDLKPLALPGVPPENFHFIQGDFFSPEVRREILERGPYDTVLSDAAPDTTGNRVLDTGRSAALAEGILAIAGEILRPGGSLAFKIFQGGEEARLLGEMRRLFSAARALKPKACRKDSFETYLIGTGYRG